MNKIRLLPLAISLLTANIAFAADEIHWTVTGPDSVAFDWRGTTSEKTIGYGVTSGVYTQVTATAPSPLPVSSSGPFWEAKLTGLAANTLYYYKIGTLPERSFRTPPAPGSSDFNVYTQGNIGSSSKYFNTGVVQSTIANDLPAFVVGLGDLTLGNIDGKASIDQHFNDVMVWSKEAAYMPVWGDRDTVMTTGKYATDNFANYKGRFAVPNPQSSPGSRLAGGEDWYWFDYGNVRFITMPEPWSGAWTDWNTKAGTLMAQAQADANIKFIVTFVHQPAYSSGQTTGSATLKGMLDALGDTYSKYKLNVNAQSNNYERSLPQHGVTHVTAGTGGANLTPYAATAKPDWSAFRAMHLGALKLHFTDSGIEGSFICGPAGGGTNDVTCTQGAVVDSFLIGTLTAKPIVSITAPNTGSTASGAVIVSANAYDNVSVAGVQFKIDGNNIGAEDTTDSYAASLDTSGLASGSHTLTAVARDGDGNITTSSPVSIVVSNNATATLPLVTDPYAIFTEPTVSNFIYLTFYDDPTFKTKVDRITGETGQGITFSSGGTGTWGTSVRHNYAKNQPWNSDGTLLVLNNDGPYVFLDGATYQPKFKECANYSRGDDRWNPSNLHANERINVLGANLEWFDVVNCNTTRSWTLPFAVASFGSGEGNASSNGRFVALADATRMFIVDMDPESPFAAYSSDNKRIGPALDVSDCGLADCGIDWVSVSPSGKYAVVRYNNHLPRVFDVNMATLALTPHPIPLDSPTCDAGDHALGHLVSMGHADMVMNPFDNNEDVIIGQRTSGCPTGMGSVIMVRLKDNTVTALTDPFKEGIMEHISTRNLDRPGWVYVSYFSQEYFPTLGNRFRDEIVAIKMDGSQTVERLAHLHSSTINCYNCQAQPVPSLDGKRVLWASNWALNGSGSFTDIKTYVADTRT